MMGATPHRAILPGGKTHHGGSLLNAECSKSLSPPGTGHQSPVNQSPVNQAPVNQARQVFTGQQIRSPVFLYFYSCSSFFPVFLFHLHCYLFCLFSPFLWETTKWPTRVDTSLNPNTIIQKLVIQSPIIKWLPGTRYRAINHQSPVNQSPGTRQFTRHRSSHIRRLIRMTR